MTNLAAQSSAIELQMRHHNSKRRLGALVALLAVSASILALSIDTIKSHDQLVVASYQQSHCEMMADSTATNFWYECPKN